MCVRVYRDRYHAYMCIIYNIHYYIRVYIHHVCVHVHLLCLVVTGTRIMEKYVDFLIYFRVFLTLHVQHLIYFIGYFFNCNRACANMTSSSSSSSSPSSIIQ